MDSTLDRLLLAWSRLAPRECRVPPHVADGVAYHLVTNDWVEVPRDLTTADYVAVLGAVVFHAARRGAEVEMAVGPRTARARTAGARPETSSPSDGGGTQWVSEKTAVHDGSSATRALALATLQAYLGTLSDETVA